MVCVSTFEFWVSELHFWIRLFEFGFIFRWKFFLSNNSNCKYLPLLYFAFAFCLKCECGWKGGIGANCETVWGKGGEILYYLHKFKDFCSYQYLLSSYSFPLLRLLLISFRLIRFVISFAIFKIILFLKQ